jgi:hypothetical protein
MSNLLFNSENKQKFQGPIGRIDKVKAELNLPKFKSKKQEIDEKFFNEDYSPDKYGKNMLHELVRGFQKGNIDKKKITDEIFDKTNDGKPMEKKEKKDKIAKMTKAFRIKNDGSYHIL